MSIAGRSVKNKMTEWPTTAWIDASARAFTVSAMECGRWAGSAREFAAGRLGADPLAPLTTRDCLALSGQSATR
jgi:hypothetical protein